MFKQRPFLQHLDKARDAAATQGHAKRSQHTVEAGPWRAAVVANLDSFEDSVRKPAHEGGLGLGPKGDASSSGGDGDELIVGLRRLRRGCIVYSFGSNGDDQFESDILKKTFCKVFTFDPTMSLEQEKMLSPGVLRNFHKIGLAKYDGVMEIRSTEREVRSLKRIMKDLKHKRIDILKVDIEGAEYDVFEELSSSGFPDIGQILVEVHAFKDFQELNKTGGVAQIPSKLRIKLDKLFRDLEGAGFRLFHKEINVLWTHPMYSNMGVEYAFLRVIK